MNETPRWLTKLVMGCVGAVPLIQLCILARYGMRNPSVGHVMGPAELGFAMPEMCLTFGLPLLIWTIIFACLKLPSATHTAFYAGGMILMTVQLHVAGMKIAGVAGFAEGLEVRSQEHLQNQASEAIGAEAAPQPQR